MGELSIATSLRGDWSAGKGPKDLAKRVLKDMRLLSQVVIGLDSKEKRVQNGCAQISALVSETRPDKVYPYIEVFLHKISAKEPILRWEAVATVGNLARVDREGKTGKAIPEIAEHLKSESVVLQIHALRALGKIAMAFPKTSRRVFNLYVGNEKNFRAKDKGFLAEGMGYLLYNKTLHREMRIFLEPLTQSPHPSVARKAKKVLKALEA